MRPSSPTGSGQPNLVPAGFFVLRTPFLPAGELVEWSRDMSAPGISDARELEGAIAFDTSELTGRLRAIVARPEVREALFIASPSLDDAVDAWLGDMGAPRARGIVDILVRYVVRMSARCTPFGLFSGCSLGRLGDSTQLSLSSRSTYRRHVRLDMHYVAALSEELQRDPAIRRAVRFRPSSALWRSEDGIRYPEARVDPISGDRSLHLVSVAASDCLSATLDRASNGETIEALAAALVDDDVSRDEAIGYVDELIAMQLLVSDLEPTITGDDPLFALCSTLAKLAPDAASTRILAAVREDLDRLGASSIGAHPNTYRYTASKLADLPAKTDLSRLFHVDLYKPAGPLTLGLEVVREMERGLSVLRAIGAPFEQADLRSFREAFEERYGRQEIPLLEALDDDRGVGFAKDGQRATDNSPLIADLPFPKPAGDPKGHRLDAFLLSAIGPILREGKTEWSLSPADIESLVADPVPDLADALYLTATIAAASPEAVGAGEFRVLLKAVGGPSGANFFGRFCHGDPALSEEVRAHLLEEEALRPDAIFAEIVHLPEGRMGNVLCRPLLRRYEIPYAGRSGASEDRHIHPSDLFVSVRRKRVTLRSQRLGREVIPRMTTAHNWTAAELGVYRFLCAVQQRNSELGWSWGTLESALPFLPRVTSGRVILTPARWNLSKAEWRDLEEASPADRFAGVRNMRRRLGLPRWVSLGDGHNLYPIDLDNILSVESCRGLLRQRERATLLEMIPPPNEVCAQGAEGGFLHEIVLPFIRKRSGGKGGEPAAVRPVDAAPAAPSTALAQAVRYGLPGSEWLYAKIYAGSAAVDRILVDVVAPVVEKAMSHGGADNWFFIRYKDPNNHIRLRIKGQPKRLLDDVLPGLMSALGPLVADRKVRSVQLDTYDREIERYGGGVGIELAERIFQADSEAVFSILRDFQGDDGADARWKLTLRGMHALLDDLQFTLNEKLQLSGELRRRFGEEHRADVRLERQLGATFRRERLELEALLVNGVERLSPGCRALAARSQRMRETVARLRAASAAGRLTCSLPDLAASYLHMHANRMLRSEQRAHELAIYDFLARLYQSEISRANQKCHVARP
jgi:thiopeptide-type bacteriocin biosynthesis protein